MYMCLLNLEMFEWKVSNSKLLWAIFSFYSCLSEDKSVKLKHVFSSVVFLSFLGMSFLTELFAASIQAWLGHIIKVTFTLLPLQKHKTVDVYVPLAFEKKRTFSARWALNSNQRLSRRYSTTNDGLIILRQFCSVAQFGSKLPRLMALPVTSVAACVDTTWGQLLAVDCDI